MDYRKLQTLRGTISFLMLEQQTGLFTKGWLEGRPTGIPSIGTGAPKRLFLSSKRGYRGGRDKHEHKY